MISQVSRSLLIFDLDGVLIDTESVQNAEIAQLLGEFGVELSRESIADSLMGNEQMSVIQSLLAGAAMQPPSDLADRIESCVQQAITNGDIAIPGMFDLLDDVSFCDLALASATPLSRFEVIDQRFALRRKFTAGIYLSHCSKFRKAEAEFFRSIAQDRNIEPAKCIVIEDNPVAAEAAVKAGMQTVGFVGGTHSTPVTRKRLQKSGVMRIANAPKELAAIIAELDCH